MRTPPNALLDVDLCGVIE